MSLNINNEYRRHMTQIEGSSLFDLSLCSIQSHNEHQDEDTLIEFGPADISENTVREQMPDILDLLLIDRTTSTSRRKKNIIWATDNYIQYGEKRYAATCQIKPELITGDKGQIIMPRALKSQEVQKERTKSKAEVFTPTWIVKKQNDAIDSNYLNDDLETYIKRRWLEITCGEAPYMASRYDMDTGELISLEDRVGFVDRKLKRINAEVHDKAEWQLLVKEAYQSSYGFEWSGDSLLLARENLLYTYRDYYLAKWREEPIYSLFKQIAEIISYNLFQMDGLQYTIPLSSKKEKVVKDQLALFDDDNSEDEWIIKPGKRVKIMNWDTKKMAFFDKGIK